MLESPTQAFSCEICEIFKNTFFTEHMRWLRLALHKHPKVKRDNSSKISHENFTKKIIATKVIITLLDKGCRGGSRTAATSKVELFVITPSRQLHVQS